MSKMRSLNPLLVILTCAASLWAWINLPDMTSYPIHWNARGEADGFSSKGGVAFVLSLMPFTAASMHMLLSFLSRAEAVKKDIEKSGLVYDITWHSCLWLFLGINILIAGAYLRMESGQPLSSDGTPLLKILPFCMGLFFFVIGNVLGKARQNKFVGVKTPWTLKSKSTWEATHRLTAWLWVGAGVLLMILPLMLAPPASVLAMVALIIGASFYPMFYSYKFYQTAPDRPE